MENKPADKLVLERTQPVQGQRVDVLVVWNGEGVGEISLPFEAWIKVKKLLEMGVEMDARQDHQLNIKLTVKGRSVVAVGDRYPTAVQPVSPTPYRGGISNLAAEDEEDAEDLQAIAAAEAGTLPPTNPTPVDVDEVITEGVIRSLRRENS